MVARTYYFRADKHKNEEEDRKHNIQNSWVFGLCPSSDIRNIFLEKIHKILF
jgi:hypothetical protein